MRECPTLFSSTETLDIYLYWNIQYIGLTTYNPTYTTNNFHPKLKNHFIFFNLQNLEISHAGTTLSVFRLWYQLWRNRQIKILN